MTARRSTAVVWELVDATEAGARVIVDVDVPLQPFGGNAFSVTQPPIETDRPMPTSGELAAKLKAALRRP